MGLHLTGSSVTQLNNAYAALPKVAATASASGAAVVNKHNPVDATGAARSISLPTGQAEGTQISVEKIDSTINAVSVTGSIRGVGASTLNLVWQFESVMFRADSSGSWWPVAGHKTVSALSNAFAPIEAALRGNRVVFLGDSITINQANDTPGVSFGVSFATYFTYLSKGRAVRARNAGVAGNTTAQMLARFTTDVTPYLPSVVVIMGGTNDWNDAAPVTLSAYQANIKALVAACRLVGAQPVLCTVPPNIVSTARQYRTIIGNTWLRRYAADQGIPLVDYFNFLVDTTTGGYLSAYNLDGTHPNNIGSAAMGSLMWTTLSSFFPAVDQLLPMDNVDPANLVSNSLNLTTSGSGTSLMPTGWSVQTSVHGSGVTGSLVTGDTTIKGNWWRIVASAATGTNNEFQTISGNYAGGHPLAGTPKIVPGHTYAHVGRFRATGLRNADSGSGSTVLHGVAFNSVLLDSNYDFRSANAIAYDVADGMFYHEMVAPSDATTALVRRQLIANTSSSGTLDIAQQGLYDLTALGIA